MNIFGIPLFVSMEVIEMFIVSNLSSYIVSSDMMVLLFFFINFMYIYCIILLIKFVYKIIMFVSNHVFN